MAGTSATPMGEEEYRTTEIVRCEERKRNIQGGNT
jgi:hypothetical protein